jgi:flagellar basal-body rod protein FlgB
MARQLRAEPLLMFIQDLMTADSLPVLETTMRFAAQRHRLILHNIANFTTPDFRPVDVDVKAFQNALGDAIDTRRSATAGVRGSLPFRGTKDVVGSDSTRLELRPSPTGRNILFHDRNTSDLERTMQDLVENTAVYRTASQLYRNKLNILGQAISGRV